MIAHTDQRTYANRRLHIGNELPYHLIVVVTLLYKRKKGEVSYIERILQNKEGSLETCSGSTRSESFVPHMFKALLSSWENSRMAFKSRQEILNLVSPCGTHLNDDM